MAWRRSSAKRRGELARHAVHAEHATLTQFVQQGTFLLGVLPWRGLHSKPTWQSLNT